MSSDDGSRWGGIIYGHVCRSIPGEWIIIFELHSYDEAHTDLPHLDVVYGWDPACPWTHQGPLATSGWSLKAKEIQILYLRSKSVATASSSLLSYVSAAHSYLPHLHSWMCRSNSYSICKWQNCVPKKNKMQNISAELIRNHFHTLIHFEINWTLEYLWISCLSIGYAYAQQHL